ncbi:hypothetical protein [Nocardia bhagyanarayanae]|uniref:Uncharacterized protein n=1 Tax=Nocardia bhagyanarayanae TaxID=1215925 RepID=A0A543F9Y8_9NOCA|nr:hypothetical protein [Nocardia bhagyanarayanae]TQM30646.1 hypothetical protein FB390_2280 [Nocardia bhagyanarayanae]
MGPSNHDDAHTLAGAFAAAGFRVAAAGRPPVEDMPTALPDTAVLESCGVAVGLVDRALRETAARLQRSGVASLRGAEAGDDSSRSPFCF